MVSIKNNVIKITQGDTLRTRVIFFIKPGVVYEPSEGDKIRFALKSSRNPVDREVLLNIDVPVTTMELVIPAELSKKVPARTLPYFYDVSDAIDAALAGITSLTYTVVEALPPAGEPGVIYLIASPRGTDDGFDEYIYVDGDFEKIGYSDIAIPAITSSEIDTILAS